MKLTILLLLSVILLAVPVALAADTAPIYVVPLSGGAVQPSTAFDYEFNYTSDAGCNNVLLGAAHTITTDARGLGFQEISTSGLTTPPEYMCEYKDGALRKRHSVGTGIFDNIFSTGTIYLSLSETIDNLVNGWVRITGGLNVTGNLNVEGNLTYKTIYAQLSDLNDQVFSAVNTKQAINLTTTDELYGLGISESNITIQTSGVYNIAAQPQVSTGAGGAGTFHMWLEKWDTTKWVNVSNSNVELVLASNEENVIPLIATLSLNENEKIRVMGSVSDTAIELDYQAIAGEPAIPSIIFTIFKLGD